MVAQASSLFLTANDLAISGNGFGTDASVVSVTMDFALVRIRSIDNNRLVLQRMSSEWALKTGAAVYVKTITINSVLYTLNTQVGLTSRVRVR